MLGRTVPSYRMVLEREIAKWKGFLKALPSKEEKEAFEELMNHCRRHAGAAGAAVRPVLSEAMIMSMLLAHEKMILEIERSIQELGKARDQELSLVLHQTPYKQKGHNVSLTGEPNL